MVQVFSNLCVYLYIIAGVHNYYNLYTDEEKPVAIIPGKAEIKKEAILITKAERMSAQPTIGMSYH